MALLEMAARQGHVHAMLALGSTHAKRKEHDQAKEWFTKGAETGLPKAMFALGWCFDKGEGGAPDYPAAVDWYRRAADAGDADAAINLSTMYAVGRADDACHVILYIEDPRFLS